MTNAISTDDQPKNEPQMPAYSMKCRLLSIRRPLGNDFFNLVRCVTRIQILKVPICFRHFHSSNM